jgi:hypothetical protein
MTFIGRGAVVGLLMLLGIAPATAAEPWVAANVQGAVLMQLGDQWTEVATGDSIASGLPVRTLQHGHVELRRRAELLELAPNTVMRVGDDGARGTVEQFAGELTLIESRGRPYRLVTPAFTAATGGAVVISTIMAGAVSLSVQRGRVPLRVKGRNLVLTAGQTFSSGSGAGFTVTGGTAAGAASAAADPDDGASGDADKPDNGAGNGGVPGNDGQNGNAGGNGNGNAGGNVNGNGNGNAGGNGNGNERGHS